MREESSGASVVNGARESESGAREWRELGECREKESGVREARVSGAREWISVSGAREWSEWGESRVGRV